MSDSNRVFEWLGNAGTVPYWLIPLNLVWSAEGAEVDLNHFRKVAAKLENEIDYWRDLFWCDGWREHLVATTCALSVGSKHFRHDIQETITRGSFVVPQLLVTLCLLHSDSARDWIATTAATAWPSERFKTYGAFEVICGHMRIPFTPPSQYRNPLESEEYSRGKEVATEHMDFWSPRIKT
jgi:hypothetical protein